MSTKTQGNRESGTNIDTRDWNGYQSYICEALLRRGFSQAEARRLVVTRYLAASAVRVVEVKGNPKTSWDIPDRAEARLETEEELLLRRKANEEAEARYNQAKAEELLAKARAEQAAQAKAKIAAKRAAKEARQRAKEQVLRDLDRIMEVHFK